jgi:hypothetical protein
LRVAHLPDGGTTTMYRMAAGGEESWSPGERICGSRSGPMEPRRPGVKGARSRPNC